MAVKERKPEDMMQVTSVRSWLLLGSIMAVLASVIVWSVTTQLPERIEGKGVLQTEAGTQAINAEERPNGIRACSILPGDIDTPLLDKRPAPPSAEARAKMMQPEDIAECVMLAVNLPARAVIEELLIRPL